MNPLKNLKDFLNWMKSNISDVIAFLKAHAIEVNIKHKATEESVKQIKISNMFVIIMICMLILIILGVVKAHSWIFP